MKNSTSFDLNQAIQHWRENLAQSPAFRRENLYELETHLRDSIALLQSRELSAEEAFLVATRRIGKSAALEAEFGKLNSSALWLDRALWIIIGAQLWSFAWHFAKYGQIFLNMSLPKANEWLATYGFGKISESFCASVLYVVALPLTILAGVKMCSIIYLWMQRHGWSPLAFLLNRPLLLAGVYSVLCVFPRMVDYGINSFGKTYDLQRFFGSPGVSSYTFITLVVLHTVVFAVLVMIIARRRLRISRDESANDA